MEKWRNYHVRGYNRAKEWFDLIKFSEFVYQRPDMQALQAKFNEQLDAFAAAESFAAQDAAMEAITTLQTEYESMKKLCNARHTINTGDEFYKEEMEFLDENDPFYKELLNRYYAALLQAKFRPELEAKWGAQLFRLAELLSKTFVPEIIEDLQQENKLASEYVKLYSSSRIEFDGEVRTIAQLLPFMNDPDRETRKRAWAANTSFFASNDAEFDRIFDEMVKVRAQIAKKLGYDSFTDVGYARMQRVGYDAAAVAKFREQVLTEIVPVVQKLKARQAERIGVDTLRFYDDKFQFKTGNAKPQGDPEWIVNNAKQMYAELAPETEQFFNLMIDGELMDLVSKAGKMFGGYCQFLGKWQVPFIFSNFNGTAGDIDVLTHEVGHAFQAYSSRHFLAPEYHFPTSEASEIHSMSMEFLTWPWMHLFFQGDTEKYKFSHLCTSLESVCYMATVDEFQHLIYANPNATPAERKQFWKELERKYMPHRSFEGNDYLENGGWWHRQLHIFEEPFYYIDYALAQMCALQFWKRSQEDFASAWVDYVKICNAGGSKSFLELIEIANLLSPFDDGSVKSVIGEIEAWLNGVDDQAL